VEKPHDLFHLAVQSNFATVVDMTLITLPQSGAIIDLDRVAFVIATQAPNNPNLVGVKIALIGAELTFFLDDARRFLELLRDHQQVDVEKLLKSIAETGA